MKRSGAILFAAIAWTSLAQAAPVSVLFVGNSYTFARVAPALQYNAGNVSDLTAAFNATDPSGTNSFPVGTGVPPNPCVTPGTPCFEPHNWGGVPGILKKMTDEAGLDYDISLSTRNAATLRGQFLDTASAAWKLRENVATRRWDVVILQEQSDAPLPAGKGKNAKIEQFNAYADQFERFIHTGDVTGADGFYTETELFGSLAACVAAGLTTGNCNTRRFITANANANAAARVYVEQSWARPDMVEAHKCTTPDMTTTDGAPIVDSTCAAGSNGSATTGQNDTLLHERADHRGQSGGHGHGPSQRVLRQGRVQPQVRRCCARRRRVSTRGEPGLRQGERFLQGRRNLRRVDCFTNQSVVARPHASEQIRFLPERTGSVPNDHRPQSAEPRTRRTSGGRSWNRAGRRGAVAANRTGNGRAGHGGPRDSRHGEPARQRRRFEQHQRYGGADGDR